MGEKFRDKYRIESTRLKNWDYSTAGFYSVTINTKYRDHYFGEIKNKEMILSEIGIITHEKIIHINTRHPLALVDEFMIMPDHIHLIIHILADSPRGANPQENNPNGANPQENNPNGANPPYFHPPIRPNIIDKTTENPNHHWQWKTGNLGSIINQFKGDVTKAARVIKPNFEWQSRFWDSIIWDARAYFYIKKYIQNNPKNWERK